MAPAPAAAVPAAAVPAAATPLEDQLPEVPTDQPVVAAPAPAPATAVAAAEKPVLVPA